MMRRLKQIHWIMGYDRNARRNKDVSSGDKDIQWTRHMIPHSRSTVNGIEWYNVTTDLPQMEGYISTFIQILSLVLCNQSR